MVFKRLVPRSDSYSDDADTQPSTLTGGDHSSRGFTTLLEPQVDTELYDERDTLLSQDAFRSAGSGSESPDEEDISNKEPELGWNDFSSRPWWKRPSIFWIIPPLLPFTMAFGGVAVPKINLILSMICRDYLSERAMDDPTFTYLPVVFGDNNPQCRIPEVQALVSKFQLVLNLVAGCLSAAVSPKLGLISDGYGRTKVIALSAFGTFLGEVITALVASRPDIFSVNVLLIGAVFDGLFGSVTTAVALTQSYAADCTSPAKRNVAFGYFHGVLFIGIALGPISAGYIIELTGNPLVVFYSVIACQIIFPIFVTLFVPESVTKERQKYNREKRGIKILDSNEFRLRNLNPLKLLTPLSILFPISDKSLSSASVGKSRVKDLQRNLIILAAIDTAIFGVAMGTMTILVIYGEYMFDWGNFESSIFVSLVSSVRVVMLLLVLPTITRVFRNRRRNDRETNQASGGSDMVDINIIRVSVLFDFLGYVGYSLVRTGALMMFSGTVAAMGAMVSPTIQSTLTKHVPSDRTGQLLGAMGLLHALARVVAPTVFNLIYSFTVGTFPQTVWICLAGVIFVGFISSWYLLPHVYIPDAASEDDAVLDQDEIIC